MLKAQNTDSKAAVPNVFGTRDGLHGRQFFHGPGQGCDGGEGDGFEMIQVHYISCALYFYDHYICPTSDYQALDPGGWGPLLYRNVSCDGDNEGVVTIMTQSRKSRVSLDRLCACSFWEVVTHSGSILGAASQCQPAGQSPV